MFYGDSESILEVQQLRVRSCCLFSLWGIFVFSPHKMQLLLPRSTSNNMISHLYLHDITVMVDCVLKNNYLYLSYSHTFGVPQKRLEILFWNCASVFQQTKCHFFLSCFFHLNLLLQKSKNLLMKITSFKVAQLNTDLDSGTKQLQKVYETFTWRPHFCCCHAP